MPSVTFVCYFCKASYPASLITIRCERCFSPLDVCYSGKSSSDKNVLTPISDSDALISLGEGNTPLISLDELGNLLGLKHLLAKLEFMNPTGSFKDRGTSILISIIKEQGVQEIVEDSSGNAGASIAAYASKAGIKANIFAPSNTPVGKTQQIRVYGAELHLINGTREDAAEEAIVYYRKNDLIYASHNLSPYFLEGTKSFGYEMVEQTSSAPPSHIVIPVGNGSLFIGLWKSLKELQRAGVISNLPKIHCVQSRVAMPIVAAYEGFTWSPTPGSKTIAGGISSTNPPRLSQAIKILKDVGGSAIAVDDSEILRWQNLLAKKEGVYAEATSASALAGLEKLIKQHKICNEDTVLLPITGSGLKDISPI